MVKLWAIPFTTDLFCLATGLKILIVKCKKCKHFCDSGIDGVSTWVECNWKRNIVPDFEGYALKGKWRFTRLGYSNFE